jgi:hypothetical protein
MPLPIGFFGGFQNTAFQNNYQTTLIITEPGPSLITFLPGSTKNQVPELSNYYATIEYLDIFGEPYTPISVMWRLWDVTNQIQLQDWTAIPIPTEEDQISIPSTYNALGNVKNLVEIREIIFWITVSGGATRYDAGIYSVLALPDVP